jgi:hypothetical protein
MKNKNEKKKNEKKNRILLFERLKERTNNRKRKEQKMKALKFWTQIIIECTDG